MRQQTACLAEFQGNKDEKVGLNGKHKEVRQLNHPNQGTDFGIEFKAKKIDYHYVDQHIDHQNELKSSSAHVVNRTKVIKQLREVLKNVKTNGSF